MSDHRTEQLGPFLDGELASAERAAVAAHLHECDACARRLEEMTAVDEAARALVVEAPPGYFDTLASRLRGRLHAPEKRRFAPPVWSLAAAAALLLAVLTPLTLRQRRPAPAVAPLQQQAAVPRAVPPVATADQPARIEPEAKSAPRDAKTEPALEKRRLEGAEVGAAGGGPASATAPQPAWSAPLREEARRDELQPAAPAGAFAGAPAGNQEVDAAKSKATASAADAESVPAQARVRASSAGAGSGSLVGSRNAAAGITAAELRYRSLLARQASTAADARSLREAWRSFAQSEASGPRADEARVRVIEVGVEAHRLSRDEEDRVLVERDAAAYLARPDAGQPERVRALMVRLRSQED